MTLDILVPTLHKRKHFLDELEAEILRQSDGYPLGILVCHGSATTGEKRNALLEKSTSDYVWFVDDDDMILPGAIPAIFEALKSEPDCLAINGIITTDGRRPRKWDIRIGNNYEEKAGMYYRFPNHITPMKREIALQVKFPHITVQEDFKWATELRERGLLKTESAVSTPVYHYRERTRK